MSKEFEFPEIREVKLVPDNHADEFIKIPVVRYEELLDAETRLDVIVDFMKSGLFVEDLRKVVLIMSAHGSDIEEFARKDGNINDYKI